MPDTENNVAGEQATQNNNVQNNSAETNNNATTGTEQEEAKFTQTEFNEALKNELARKTKGLPSKEELKAFNEWKEAQKTAEQKQQEDIIKMQNLQNDNDFKSQMLEIMQKGISYEDAEFIQFKVSKMTGEFSDNLEEYLKNNTKYTTKKEEKPGTTGFSQNNTNKVVSEDKAYLDKKYANNPYYKK